MTAVKKHLGTLMLLLSCAIAQNSAVTTIRSVTAARQGDNLRVEIMLSAPVKPSSETASNPDRILLDLPDTISNNIKSVGVHANGVRRVRTGQHSTNPLVTRIVLDLDRAHPYTVKTEGNRIIVAIGAAENARSSSHGAPVAATSGNLIGVFRRRHDTAPSITEDTSEDFPPLAPPATTAGPRFEPPSTSSPVATVAPGHPVAPLPQSQVPQSQTASPSVQNSAGQASLEQSQIAGVAQPDFSATTATPSKDTTAPIEPAKAPATEESATPVTAVPATAPNSSVLTAPMIARSDDPSLRTVFKVRYVAEGVAYLEGGRAQGLTEGMKLEVEETNLPATQGDSVSSADPRVIAELEVTGVAEMSAVTDIHTSKRPVKVGDLAYLSSSDAEALVQQRTLSATRQYPAVISFTEGDAFDEEAREEVPRPTLPSVNRARGRIGFDSIETISHGTSSVTSSDVGMVFRGDITRIGGTYWNLSGYWRGELTKASAASQQTLQNLINRTYHLNMTYDNPNSTLVAGFGRLYLPWAPSLDTIDGGYFGKRLSKGTTLGVFGGSTPDPSSWDYSPNRVISGGFFNFEGGEYKGLHYSSTSGAGVSMVNWAIDRPFIFFEDSLSYKRAFAIYESAQLDNPKGNSVIPSPGPGLGRNFFTLRVNPLPRVELDFNYNYFRDIPTFDTNLVGTGLLDKYLFQGFSAGGRLEVWKQIWLSTNLGQSSGTGDAKTSLNQMYGITFGRLPRVKLRADAHYARFDGSFGAGSYEALALSRQMSERLRLEVLLGQQNFASVLTNSTRGRFVTGTVETTLGPHYYLQGNFTTNRGDLSYDQFMFSLGYRFDSKRRGE
jgi:AMIN domain